MSTWHRSPQGFLTTPSVAFRPKGIRLGGSRNYVNVIVAGKQPSLQFLDMDAAVNHCTAGVKIWEWASNDRGAEPDVVMVCAGDVPTLAAVTLLHEHAPELKMGVVTSRRVISVTATAFCRVSITQPVLSGAVSVHHWRRRRTDRPV